MTEVLEAKQELEDARAEANAMVARKRARLGLVMIRSRERGAESQATIAKGLGVGPQQVRAYEQAYRDWAKEHPDESLD